MPAGENVPDPEAMPVSDGLKRSCLAAPEWCIGCPYPIYDNRKGEWDWYCRQWSPTGIRCSNVAVLRDRCYRVREYFARKEASK